MTPKALAKKLWGYREFWGTRIAWKIGDLTGEDCYSRRYGQFSVTLDFNVDSGTFKEYTPPGVQPWRVLNEYLDHSLSVMVWRWGFWIDIRGRKQ